MGAAAGVRLRLMDLHAHPARVVQYDPATHGVVGQSPKESPSARKVHGLWQRQRNGDFAVYRMQDGLRLRYPGEPLGGLQLTRTSRIRVAPGRWCTHRWLVTADGHEQVIEVVMRFGQWLRFALADPWDGEDLDLLAVIRNCDESVNLGREGGDGGWLDAAASRSG